MERWAALQFGHSGLVCYGEDGGLYHERLFLVRIQRDIWAVATPDEDLYAETLSEMVDAIELGPRGGLPRQFRRPVHRFDPGVMRARQPV
eukprot:10230494-Lingulodinium_polyedra.AAC.1